MNFAFKTLSFLLVLSFVGAAHGQFRNRQNATGGFNPYTFAPEGATPLFQQQVGPAIPIAPMGGVPFTPVGPAASGWFGGSNVNGFGSMAPTFQRPPSSLGFSWNFSGANEQFDLKLNDTPNDNSFYSIDNLFGCEVPQDNYNLELSNSLDFNSCFDQNSSGVYAAASPEHLRNDLKACNCLKESPLTSVKEIMAIPLNSNHTIDVNKRAERAYGAGLNQVLSGVAFQSYVLAHKAPEEVRARFVRDYAKSPFPYNPNVTDVLIKKDGEYSLNLKPEDYSSLGKDKLPLFTPITKPDGTVVPVCLSMATFHRMRQMPDQKEMRHILADLDKDYEPSDWNYHELQRKYEDIMDDSPSDRQRKVQEIAKLKTKLSFLNRNPLVKYMLGADQGDYDSVTEGGEYLGGSGFDLKQKQTEIFNVVKRNLLNPLCTNSPGGASFCGARLRGGLRSIFGNPSHSALIGDVVRSDMRDDIVNRARKVSKTINKSLPDNKLNQLELNSRFEREFNIQRPADCRGSSDLVNVNQATDQCLMKMSAYCQFLEPYKDQISNRAPASEDPEIADTLSSELEDDFNSDQNTNEAFQQANEEYCHTPFKKIDGDVKQTFFEFMNTYCQNSSNEGCAKQTPQDWDKLRDKFKDLHDFTSSNFNGRETTGILTADTGSEDKAVLPTRGGSTGGSAGGSDYEDPFEFLSGGTYDPNCKKFCVGTPSGTSVSGGGSSSTDASTDNDKKPFFASMGETVRDVAAAGKPAGATQTNDQVFGGNYQSDFSGATNSTLGPQNLASKEVQDQIVNQLEERISEVETTNPTSPDLRALQADLAAIRASFAQSQLTNKSLNDKLLALEKAQEIMTRNNLAPAGLQPATISPTKGRSPSSVPNSRVGLSDLDRTMTAARENQNTGPISNGASVSGSLGGRGRIAGGTDSSSDAVRREEGKLVNVESTVDGRLTVTTAARGAGVTPNALSVEVPMNLYQSIQANPEGIDLSQINISEAQMSEVKNGEFTLLVNSGDGNPPFKVQVQIKNNRLVRADRNNDGQPDKQVQTIRLNDLNLVFRPIIQANAN